MKNLLNIPPLPSSADQKHYWGGLEGTSLLLAICESVRAYPGLSLVIVNSSQAVFELESAFDFFLKEVQQKEVLPERDGQRQQTFPAHRVLSFPDWETLPYDNFSPHQDIISQRIEALSQLAVAQQGCATLVVGVATLLHWLAPRNYVGANTFEVKIGQTFQVVEERRRLEALGYNCVETVYEHGEFALRGSILDVFPMGCSLPVRIELFDDEISTLRAFDPETQRSKEKFDSVRVLPAREIPLSDKALNLFKQNFREQFDVDYTRCPLYQDISEGIAASGIEYYLALFFDELESFFQYLPKETLIFCVGDLVTAVESFWQETQQRYEEHRYDVLRPILPPEQVYLKKEEFFAHLKQFKQVVIPTKEHEARYQDKTQYKRFVTYPPPELSVNNKLSNPLSALTSYIAACSEQNKRVLFCAESAGRRETLLELFSRYQFYPKVVQSWIAFLETDIQVAMTVGALDQGLELDEWVLISESQLFGHQVFQTRRQRKQEDIADNIVRDLTELKLGAPVVHINHGVGRYQGLVKLEFDGQSQEFLSLQYSSNDKLYVPVSSLHLISRYAGLEEERAPLHALGSEQWQKEKRKAMEKVHDTAAQLLHIYARRAAKEGYAFTVEMSEYEKFSSQFPFEETADQKKAIVEVLTDLKSGKPMDRLVCGDVGFGKTEVAMRAAFVVLQQGFQIIVLVPTTLLAQQHYETFKDRFAEWPVNIEVLSRFKSSKDQAEVLKKFSSGAIDIVIGTHKLLQDNVKPHKLGLVIIDEEHRFGVRQKERLKSFCSDVDILALTATPIPRTLNMAMSGIKDISIIATPPEKRLSIKTFVREYNKALVKEAVLRELRRGGQVYYLHNEVKSIEKAAENVQTLVQEARVGVAHGQLREKELEKVMSDFYHKRFNVLVCTTIIETGIDIPTANTIIMARADKLGLAQLHQLRGRVGRSHHQAYAFLFTPNKRLMTADAIKRLEAISQADNLGAGFTLASHDLEIRGAGEFLGEEQSGHITKIGFSLYMDMLDKAVSAIKAGKVPDLDQPFEQGCEINLRSQALIPDDYLPDVHMRLIFYKRIANADSSEGLRDLQVEMIDRFGLLPIAVKHLFLMTQLKLQVQDLGISKIEYGPEGGYIQFSEQTRVDPMQIVKWVQMRPQQFQLSTAHKLRLLLRLSDVNERIDYLEGLIRDLRV